jgi:hypothetical protein
VQAGRDREHRRITEASAKEFDCHQATFHEIGIASRIVWFVTEAAPKFARKPLKARAQSRSLRTSTVETALGSHVNLSTVIGCDSSQVPLKEAERPFVSEGLKTRGVSRIVEPHVVLVGPGGGRSDDFFSVSKGNCAGHCSHWPRKQILIRPNRVNRTSRGRDALLVHEFEPAAPKRRRLLRPPGNALA